MKATYIGPYGAMESKAFINASNAGLTSETILSAESFKILGGKAGYLLAGIKTLLAYKNREIRLVVDGGGIQGQGDHGHRGQRHLLRRRHNVHAFSRLRSTA